MDGLMQRMIRAAKLDVQLYEEVEADRGALGQAMLVVVLSSVASGIGLGGLRGLPGALLGALAALVAWLVWAALIYFIGTKLLPEPQTRSDVGELLRTTGFASTPGILRIVCIIPGIRSIALTIISIWMLWAMIIAVRQALDYRSTLRTIGVCLIGFIVQGLVLLVFGKR